MVVDTTAMESGSAEPNPWLVHDGSVDYKGNPADKRRTGGWKAAPLIFVTEMCERLAAFGIALNLVTYLVNNLHLPAVTSANIVTNNLGTANLISLLFGFLADTWLGRFRTILLGCCLQFLGMVVLTLSATLPVFRVKSCELSECKPAHGWTLVSLYAGLYLVAAGSGGIKACVSALGADQFDDKDRRERKLKSAYFNWFFMAVEIGALLSITVLVYIQIKLGQGWNFGVCVGAMLFAIVVFIGGVPMYRYQTILKGSPISQVILVFAKAFSNRKLPLPPVEFLHETLIEDLDTQIMIPHTHQFCFLDKAAITSTPKPSTITQVEEVKCVLRMLPIATLTIVFYTTVAQMMTFTLIQGLIMKRNQLGFQIPPASLFIFRELSIMLILAFYGPKLVTFIRSFTGHERGITTLQRIGVGLVFSILSMLVAAIIEAQRRKIAVRNGMLMSVFWLVPQFVLVGVGEAFIYVGQLEFYYEESPVGMRSIGTAMFFCTISFGFFTSSALVSMVNWMTNGRGHGWLATDLNEARLDYFYAVLLGTTVANLVGFVMYTRWYKYKAKPIEKKLSDLLPCMDERS